MKILFITNNINQIGGVDRIINRLANEFNTIFKHDIEILSLNTTYTDTFFKFNDEVKISHAGFNLGKINSLKDRITYRKTLIKNISNILNCKSYDIIFTFHSYISDAVLSNKKNLKGKIIVTEHGSYNSYSKLRKIINNYKFRKADKVIVLTESDNRLYSKYLKNVDVIPNPISFKSEKISTHKEKRILAVGRLEEEKGFDYLIDIFNLVHQKHKDWKLDIIGDGSQREKLYNKIIDYELNEHLRLLPFSHNIKSEMLA